MAQPWELVVAILIRKCQRPVLNTACSGKFTSDRTIQQYVDEIWHLDKVVIGK